MEDYVKEKIKKKSKRRPPSPYVRSEQVEIRKIAQQSKRSIFYDYNKSAVENGNLKNMKNLEI